MCSEVKVKFVKLNPAATVPAYGTADSAGADLCALTDTGITVQSGETVLIHTGIALEIPAGLAGFIYARSGLATKKGLAPANKVGVIDSDYRGEIMIPLHNHSRVPAAVSPGDRIAQIVFAPYYKAVFEEDSLTESERGEGGFGSTGI